MRLGRLQVEVWRDTGTPRFRLYWWRYRPKPYAVCTHRWVFKLMSWYTLYVAWHGRGEGPGG
jgi:hypothetical protein